MRSPQQTGRFERHLDFSIFHKGYACDTLKEFAQQADIEIVYNASSVENITTNTIHGTMDPEDGLTLMLKGTLLIMEKDPKAGAFAVKKNDK